MGVEQKQRQKQKNEWNIRPYLEVGLTCFIIFCCAIAVVCVVFRFSAIKKVLEKFMKASMPIIYGLIIGYLINPIMMFFEKNIKNLVERKEKKEKWYKLIRTCSSILAILIFILFISVLLYLVIPQVAVSITKLAETMPSQVKKLMYEMEHLQVADIGLASQFEPYLEMAADYAQDWVKTALLPKAQGYIAVIATGATSALVMIKNLVIGMVASIYVLCEKERFIGQAKKIVFALFPPKAANQIIQIFHTTDHIFGGFIKGKMLDSLIIGVICYIGLMIFHMPYALLVSVIVGVTNVIPFFGPLIGAIPSALLILLESPLYALYFIIFVVVLQQVDGNIIGPKILGDSMGLSSFWIIFAILVGSGLYGVAGMLFGCPVFAVIYYIVQKVTHVLLRKKKMPLATSAYVQATGVELNGSKLWYGVYADEVDQNLRKELTEDTKEHEKEHIEDSRGTDEKEGGPK